MTAPRTIAELYRVPVVAKHTNCVSFATRDITAVLFRSAWRASVVMPAIRRYRNVKRKRNGDICIWYNKDWPDAEYSFHFAYYWKGNCIMKHGLGEDAQLMYGKFAEVCASERENFANFKIVRNFRLPLWSKRLHRAERKVLRLIRKKQYGEVVKVFERIDKIMTDSGCPIPVGKPINKGGE